MHQYVQEIYLYSNCLYSCISLYIIYLSYLINERILHWLHSVCKCCMNSALFHELYSCCTYSALVAIVLPFYRNFSFFTNGIWCTNSSFVAWILHLLHKFWILYLLHKFRFCCMNSAFNTRRICCESVIVPKSLARVRVIILKAIIFKSFRI